jgi:hypothetical protein
MSKLIGAAVFAFGIWVFLAVAPYAATPQEQVGLRVVGVLLGCVGALLILK